MRPWRPYVSVQFGRWNFDGKPISSEYMERVSTLLRPYAPDGITVHEKENVRLVLGAFHTTKESRSESQPYLSCSGAVLTWDGRLDNRSELIGYLHDVVNPGSTDVAIVAAAYDRWGINCFARFLGDWALSVWDENDHSLILAKDLVGTRHLYYLLARNEITWATILDPLLLFAGQSLALNEEYIAGWLSFFPAAHLTPYVAIHSVPQCSFFRLKRGKQTVQRYWEFNPGKTIRYRSDEEYEKHFRTVFADAVARRLRSDSPVLAELSGGMDSSAVVCMADAVMNEGRSETSRLDTLSYYDDSEPNWNERPYFTAVENKRNRIGFHIDVSSERDIIPEYETDRVAPAPDARKLNVSGKQLRACLNEHRNRVLLSGIGGDEVLGGVPTPIPELADCMARAHFKTLAHQMITWALVKRDPLLHLLAATIRAFLPVSIAGVPTHRRPAPWVESKFARRYRAVLAGYQARLRIFGPLPSFQENLVTLGALCRQLSCSTLSRDPLYERSYPYLDRDLLEFLFAIPREQLVRPHQRRSLMRRALVGIVPDQILNRKRKAFVARGPLVALCKEWPAIVALTQSMVSSSLGFINGKDFVQSMQNAHNGEDVSVIALIRTLQIELWLRHLSQSRTGRTHSMPKATSTPGNAPRLPCHTSSAS
jgi:asparagine synthase (glutamine-hydrolysing)